MKNKLKKNIKKNFKLKYFLCFLCFLCLFIISSLVILLFFWVFPIIILNNNNLITSYSFSITIFGFFLMITIFILQSRSSRKITKILNDTNEITRITLKLIQKQNFFSITGENKNKKIQSTNENFVSDNSMKLN